MADEVLDEVVVDGAQDGGEQAEIPAVETPVVEAAAAPEQIRGDERTLPRWIRDLKSTRPDDFRAASDNFYQQKALTEKLKDRDIDGTFGWLDEAGGREALETRLSELDTKAQEYDGLLQAASSGDPSVVGQLFDAAGDKAEAIGTAAMQQWNQRDPDGYNAALSGVFAATIQNGQTKSLFSDSPVTIPQMMAEARAALQYAPDDQKGVIAQHLMQRFEQFFGSFAQQRQAAAQAPKQASELAAFKQQVAEKESTKFNSETWEKNVSNLNNMARENLKDYFSRQPNNKTLQDVAVREVVSQVNELLKKDGKFNDSFKSHMGKKDADGALRLAASRQKLIITEIAQQVGRSFFGNPAASAAPAKVVPKATPQATVRQGDTKRALLGEIFARN